MKDSGFQVLPSNWLHSDGNNIDNLDLETLDLPPKKYNDPQS